MCDKKCKNIECDNLIQKNRTYCSLTCRNIYVNKYLRDYSKIAKALSKEKRYDENPKFCKNCNAKLSYEKRRNDYCNSYCSGKHANLGRKLSEESKNKIRNSIIKNEDNLKRVNCKNCDIEFLLKKRKIYCSDECRISFARRNMSEFEKYKRECMFRFNLSDYPEEFNFNLIKEFGWYKPTNRGNNLDGVSRDHIYSVRDGFDNDVDPSLISHPANCKLILQRQNSSKYKRSDITIVELKEKIKNWKLKYNE